MTQARDVKGPVYGKAIGHRERRMVKSHSGSRTYHTIRH
jgi:hypothetical protein